MGAATSRFLGQTAPVGTASAFDPAWTAFGGAAFVAVIVTILRQFFSGFWFHPVGIVLGGTDFMNYIWGSALTAWVIRSVVLRMGGAATVRNKLQPFFVGVFLGGCAGYLVLLIYAAYLRSLGLMPAYTLLTP